jgi:hypothetical protein
MAWVVEIGIPARAATPTVRAAPTATAVNRVVSATTREGRRPCPVKAAARRDPRNIAARDPANVVSVAHAREVR